MPPPSGGLYTTDSGFSLIDLVFSMTITLGISLVAFELFLANERVFRDQTLLVDMHRNARAVAALIADEIRRAGEGVPVFSGRENGPPSEALQVFLDGTRADAIRFRSSLENGVEAATGTPPVGVAPGQTLSLDLAEGSRLQAAAGSWSGRFVYLAGPGRHGWTWVRAEVLATPDGEAQVLVAPTALGDGADTFTAPVRVTLEGAVSYRLSRGSVRRGRAADPTAPAFTEEAVGDDFTRLRFTYYDAAGTRLDASTPAMRAAIRRVDFVLVARTAAALSGGAPGSHSIAVSVHPPNLTIR